MSSPYPTTSRWFEQLMAGSGERVSPEKIQSAYRATGVKDVMARFGLRSSHVRIGSLRNRPVAVMTLTSPSCIWRSRWL
jgi:hypothetical protein